jgi:osmotically-inducible protein OsmY
MLPRSLLRLATATTSTVLTLVTVTACSTAPAPSASSTTAISAAHAAPPVPVVTALAADPPAPPLTVSDDTLAAAITAAIARDPALRDKPGDGVRVSVMRGQVTLRGNVRSLVAKRRAAAIVNGLRGATALEDELVVVSPARPDADIARDIERSFRTDTATRGARVKTTLSAGVVTLRGTVSSLHQRQLLEDEAARVPGVRAVTLAVSLPMATRAPQEVTSEVNGRLHDDARLVGAHVLVAVTGRSAVLSGAVASLAQREAAIDDARVAGIDDVVASGLEVDPGTSDRDLRAQASAAADDGHLGDVVRRAFASDERVGQPAPAIHVEHGVVTLSGNIGDFRAEKAAVEDANQVRGVRRVDDQTTVAPALLETDAVIQSQVERSVLNDLEAPDAPHLQITTSHGKVTLRGAVFSPEERRVIEDDVEAVPGVASVENDLSIRGYAAESTTPAHPALRIRVIENIFWDARVGGGKVTVDAAPDGSVTLSGRVDTPEQAKAAVEDATRAGAVRVVDHLTVATADDGISR